MTMLILGDAQSTVGLLPSESVNFAGTSPPYFQQRDYEVAGQIGREKSIRDYLERLWSAFDEVKRVLKPDGTCFVNLGDKYISKGRLAAPRKEFAIGMRRKGVG